MQNICAPTIPSFPQNVITPHTLSSAIPELLLLLVSAVVCSRCSLLSWNMSISIIQTDGSTLMMYRKQLGQKLDRQNMCVLIRKTSEYWTHSNQSIVSRLSLNVA